MRVTHRFLRFREGVASPTFASTPTALGSIIISIIAGTCHHASRDGGDAPRIAFRFVAIKACGNFDRVLYRPAGRQLIFAVRYS